MLLWKFFPAPARPVTVRPEVLGKGHFVRQYVSPDLRVVVDASHVGRLAGHQCGPRVRMFGGGVAESPGVQPESVTAKTRVRERAYFISVFVGVYWPSLTVSRS